MLASRIHDAYERMLDAPEPIHVEAATFHADLTAPSVAAVSPAMDMNEAVAEMERYFKEWDDTTKTRKGKN